MTTMMSEYFKLTEKYKKKYGEKAVVLMQVGAFFEIYGLKEKNDENTLNFVGSQIGDISFICDLKLSNKKQCVDKSICGKKTKYDVFMGGFGVSVLEKYLRKLDNAGYTCVVYTQDSATKNTTRSLYGIFSPGTYFNTDETNKITNTTTVIWLDRVPNILLKTREPIIYVGISSIDIYTGKTDVFEYNVPNFHSHTSYDEIERTISTHNPSETVIIYNKFDIGEVEDIIQFCNIQSKAIHKIELEEKTQLAENAKKCEKQKFQEELLKRFYSNDISDDIINDLRQHTFATQAFCFMLDFIYDHNPDLVKRIARPEYQNDNERVILGNYSLKQLNIIDDHAYRGKLSSIMSFLNECLTPMGKRAFKYNLVNPINNIQKLQREYNIIEYCKDNKTFDHLRKNLVDLKDIEKNKRKLALKRLTPRELYYIFSNLNIISSLYELYSNDETIYNYTKNFVDCDIKSFCNEITDFLNEKVDIEKCADIDMMIFEDNIFQKGIYPDLDVQIEKLVDAKEKLASIQKYLSSILEKFEKKGNKIKTEFVKIHETEKMGYSLIATSRRTKILETKLPKTTINLNYFNSFTQTERIFKFDPTTIHYQKASGNNSSISNGEIDTCCSNLLRYRNKIKTELSNVYIKFIEQFYTTFDNKLQDIVIYTTTLDMIQCKSYIAYRHNYNKPSIVVNDENNKSFISMKNMRHPLIEQLQTKEIYVPNDVNLGVNDLNQDGILLFGTNAVGKSSLIRSIGVNTIMAQSGMFVACDMMEYYPYKSLFTRILGNDNIFKSLSTFAVEMTELRTILKLADENSLILGDELCSSTETGSAISIFVAGLMKLYESKSSFIFATHFHEIVPMEEVTNLNTIKMMHMTVRYNRETNNLVYDRKLKEGSGDNMYGLEVCKALDLPSDFLDLAHTIRKKREPAYKNVTSLGSSHFNQEKIVGICEFCKKEPAVDVHHLQHQKNANEDGFIGTFHKNHIANLISVCKKCHNFFHKDDTQYQKVKTSDGFVIEPIQ